MSPVCSAESYPNDRPKLGLVEIINNLDSEQKPTQKDVRELTHAFRWIGMDVKRPNLDLEANAMESKLNHILRPHRYLRKYNIFVLAIICHGIDEDKLLSSDGEVVSSVKVIEKQFDEMKDMVGQPKILIVECCRGSSWNFGITIKGKRGKMLAANNVPNRADVLAAFSTVPDHVSHTQSEGSPFILELTNQIKMLAEERDLETILKYVRGSMSKKNIQGVMQMPQTTSTLRKDVWLKMREKTYFEEGKSCEGIIYRKFGDPNGQGQICWADRHFCNCNFKNGEPNFNGKFVFEWSDGRVLEVTLRPGSSWNDWTGKGVMYSIRKMVVHHEGKFRCGNLNDVTNEDGFPFLDSGRFSTGEIGNEFSTGTSLPEIA